MGDWKDRVKKKSQDWFAKTIGALLVLMILIAMYQESELTVEVGAMVASYGFLIVERVLENIHALFS